MISSFYDLVVKGNQKAIVAFILPLVGMLLAFGGLSLDMTVGEAIASVVTAAINSAGVWLKANK